MLFGNLSFVIGLLGNTTTFDMIRIAYLVSQYPAINHTYLLNEIRQLRRIGIEVHSLSVRGPDRRAKDLSEVEHAEMLSTHYILPDGVLSIITDQILAFVSRPIAYLDGVFFSLRMAGLNLRRCIRHLAYFAEAIAAGRWLRQRSINHVHSHFSSTVVLLLARMYDITISITIHGPDEFSDPVGFLMREKCHEAKAVIAISSFGRSQLLRYSDPSDWPKIRVSRLGVTVRDFHPSVPRLNPLPFELICVGRLEPVKGHHILLDAIAKLLAEKRSVRLRIVGSGTLRESLHQQVTRLGLESAVVFEGVLKHDRVLELYHQADLAVLASFAEGVPVALMESMAMGLPAVTTWVNGIPELVRNGVEGLLVTPADSDEIAAAVGNIMDDPELRLRMGVAARRRILDAYDLEKNVQRLGDVFRELQHSQRPTIDR